MLVRALPPPNSSVFDDGGHHKYVGEENSSFCSTVSQFSTMSYVLKHPPRAITDSVVTKNVHRTQLRQ